MSTTRPTIDTERLKRIIADADALAAARQDAGEKLKEARRALAHENSHMARLELHYGQKLDPDSKDVRLAVSKVEAAKAAVAIAKQEHDRVAAQMQRARRLESGCRDYAARHGVRLPDDRDSAIVVHTGAV